MREVFQKMTECLGRGESAVLVTVTAASGSTPRKAGARMLVTGDGLAAGTIGGGAVEHASIELAAQLLREGRSRRKHFILTENEAADIGMICGGDTDVYFQYVSGDDGNARRLFEEILAAAGGEREVWLILDIEKGRHDRARRDVGAERDYVQFLSDHAEGSYDKMCFPLPQPVSGRDRGDRRRTHQCKADRDA